MRNELATIERIENYLTGKLSEAETKAFEAEMNANAELKEQVQLQRELMEGIARKALMQDAQRAHRKYRLGKNGLNWGLGGFAMLVVAAAAWFFTTQLNSETSENLRYGTNELGTKEFADADRFLPSQIFDVDGSKDTVIQTEGGITMTILANTFLDKDGNPVKGNIDLEVKEALDPLSIMKGGLTTMSGDQLLESGGMFYVNGRQGKESLRINPDQGIYTQVPTDEKQPNMQLFDGNRLADGRIDWVNPKPLETFLTPVEITTLNFYPPDYLDELENRGYDKSDKRFTDSLYYSYADLFTGMEIRGIGSIPDGLTEQQALKLGLIVRDTIYPNWWVTEGDYAYGINPVSIKTIWNEKFNNTNLATKEFEERLAHIHNTCDQWILDYYVNNLDKRLSTLDSTVAQNRDSKYPESEVLDRFWEFARRGDGRVEADNKYAEYLKGYYHRQAKVEAEAISLVRKKYNAENMRKLQEAQGKQTEHLTKEAERISENWQQEFRTNLKEAYRQLGYSKPVRPRGKRSNNVIVTTPGWKNVDAYVAESVTKRETLDFTDKDGNRAGIKYEAITLQVANAAEFDRVLVYMLPDNLYSFQRMNQNGNTYSEKLNELFEYDVMCIGFKGDERFIHHIKKAEAKDHGTVSLEPIQKMELEKLLYSVKDYSVQSNLREDLAYQRFETKERKRVEKLMAREQLRNEMHHVVFPCSPRRFYANSEAGISVIEEK